MAEAVRGPTLQEAAAFEFEPWDAEKTLPLAADDWNAELSNTGPHAVTIRVAYMLLIKAKPELVRAVTALFDERPEAVEDVLDNLQNTSAFLRCLANYTETAHIRLLAASAAAALASTHSGAEAAQ